MTTESALRALVPSWVAFAHGYAHQADWHSEADWRTCTSYPCNEAARALLAQPQPDPERWDCGANPHGARWYHTDTCAKVRPSPTPPAVRAIFDSESVVVLTEPTPPAVAPAPNSAPNPPAPGERRIACGRHPDGCLNDEEPAPDEPDPTTLLEPAP